ncbi:hypothetical protein GCM10008015_12750 [Flavobacterium palustre]|uniref:Inner membrane protein YgaP-like transmembrane domain-containing protein n=1 Tax=Flavobacterium palustre TaxID=1476463 RepID=A0ABQ1HFD0_9FLAO|nr:DUF2892 domain-containing protein [Flavobacterium palustre]GGA73571.1 hypothetical protein GCM10008015_12750 [Flavobacterium palustre]
MKHNIGKTDKTIRVIIAVAIMTLYFTGNVAGNLGIALMAFAVILLITVGINFCPFYTPWGIDTYKKNKEKLS